MPKHKSETLPVVIRYEGRGKADRKDWHSSDIVAIFPTEPGTNAVNTMSCYCPLGEHSSCASSYAGRTKPATKAQVRYMLRALRLIGYKNLRVVSRASPSHYKARRRALENKGE